MSRAILAGIGAGVLVSVVYGVLWGGLGITFGLIAVSALGGAGVGVAVRRGAWGAAAHRSSPAPERLGLLLGAVTWAGCMVASWLAAMATLPASARSLLDRLTSNPFLDWLGPQLGVLELFDLALLASVAWVTARSASVSD
jgi:hypothetical protein